jgi:hypothetical protein
MQIQQVKKCFLNAIIFVLLIFLLCLDKQIQTYLDYFDWVQQTSGSICVPHTTMLVNSSCESIQKFFKENANSFKPRV